MSHLVQDDFAHARAGFVRFQQELARQALLSGSIGAARAALRVLRPGDFACEPVVSARLLMAVRDARSTEDDGTAT